MREEGQYARRSQRGQAATLRTADPSKRLTIQKDPDTEARTHTITFGIDAQPAASKWIRMAEALISFTVDGNTVTRRVSVIEGMSVSCVGQGVSAIVSDVSLPDPAGATAPEDYGVVAILAPGTRGSGSQPPVLIPAILPSTLLLPPGGSVVVPIPSDAGATSVGVTVYDTAFGVVPENVPEVAQRIGVTPLRRYDPRNAGSLFIPLAPGATNIQLTNHSGVLSLQFSLTFGIDG